MSPAKPSVSSPGEFAARINEFVAQLNAREGWDTSGRKMAAHVGVRGRNYWMGVFDNERNLNTDDIAALADAFGLDPFNFIDIASRGAIDEVPPFRGNVGGDPEDDMLHVGRDDTPTRADVALAAKRGKTRKDAAPSAE